MYSDTKRDIGMDDGGNNMDYMKLSEILAHADDTTVDCLFNEDNQCISFTFEIPVRQSFKFVANFSPLNNAYRVAIAMDYEDYLDIFNLDDDEDEDAEDKYYEFLDEHENINENASVYFSLKLMHDWAVNINDETNYIDDSIINLLEQCENC